MAARVTVIPATWDVVVEGSGSGVGLEKKYETLSEKQTKKAKELGHCLCSIPRTAKKKGSKTTSYCENICFTYIISLITCKLFLKKGIRATERNLRRTIKTKVRFSVAVVIVIWLLPNKCFS
jgi:hypothetical protein